MADVASSAKTPNKITQIGAYHIGKTIGKGNFAVVKLAEHSSANEKDDNYISMLSLNMSFDEVDRGLGHEKTVAIKMIDKSQLDEDNLAKTMREVRIMKMVNHTNIIRLYEVMETERYLYLVIEYASRGEIFDLLKQTGPLNETDARKMFRQIIAAVECLHQKRIVHRDLKAENLLLDERNRIKLADFGFSNIFDVGAKLKTWCGSPPYAAPELFEGKEYYGPAADIWSMGVVLYVLVCGALPFDGRTLPDFKQRIMAGKFRIPYFMSLDCENLIRHMLVVDLNKRYTLNQIKQHKWIIQGEPYEFLEEEDEFCYAQQHINGTENGNSAFNENIIEQMEKLGEKRSAILESIQNKRFDNLYGLYHILLDKHLKDLRDVSLASKNASDFSRFEPLSISSRPKIPFYNDPVQLGFHCSNIKFEEGEPNAEEIARYLSGRRRETIAGSHVSPQFNNPLHFDIKDNNEIPGIEICRSPTPPSIHDTSQLQFKEQFLPRPAVWQVRPQFDRRASDGATKLQESILQFNVLNANKYRNQYNHFSMEDDEKESRNLVHVPAEKEATSSESDNEPDLEAVQRYMNNRGTRKRHTITTTRSHFEQPTFQEYEGNIGALKAFHQQMHTLKPRPTTKISNRERERASPTPYLPVSPEQRRIVSDRRQSDGGLSILYSDKKKDESDNMIKQLQAQHKRLKDKFSNTSETRSHVNQRRPQIQNNTLRYSYPSYEDNDNPNIIPAIETEMATGPDPSLIMLQQKHEVQSQNMHNQYLVKRKILEKQMEAETDEFIRRVSEGAPGLESSIKDFLAKHKTKEISDDLQQSPLQSTDLQDEMKKLNLKVSSGMPGSQPSNEPLHFQESLFPDSSGEFISHPHPVPARPAVMDIDDTALLSGDLRPRYPYANMGSLFSSPTINNNTQRGRRFPMSPGMVNNIPSRLASQDNSNVSESLINNQGLVGGMLWGGESNDSENTHQSLSRTLSVDLRSTLDINEIVSRVQSYFDKRVDLDYNQSDTCFSLYKDGIQAEMEVYPLTEGSNVNGIKIRRVGGEVWSYKKLRDEIIIGLDLE